MERRILRLARALREAGAPVSTAETLDAGRAALAVGVERRGDLRAALRAALVKDAAFLADFARLFDREFPAAVPRPERRGRRGTGGRAAAPGGEGGAAPGDAGRPGGAAAGPGGNAEPGGAPPAGAAPRPGEPPPALRASREGPGGEPDGEAADAADGEPDGEAAAEGARIPGAAGAGPERRAGGDAETQEEEEEEAPPRRLLADVRRSALGKGFRERWGRGDQAAALAAMEELAGRLATRLARREARSRRGALDVRATLRANLRHGGVPFAVARRARRPGRRDLVLLADVSGSVRVAAALFLLVLGRLRARFSGVRAFAYTDRPVEIPAALAQRPPAEIAAALAETLPVHALSDHGEVLRRFNRDFGRAVTGRTVVVILGDGRSNRFPAQEWELEAIARRARRLVWIVPEPKALWGSGDSAMPHYAPRCDAVIAAPNPGALAGAAAAVLETVAGRRAGRNKSPGARYNLRESAGGTALPPGVRPG